MIRFLMILLCGLPLMCMGATPTCAGLHFDEAELRSRVNALIEMQLERSKIAGAVAVVTCGDQTILLEGYGYADLAQGQRVDPQTVFRLGSVSKLLTSLAVMQLVEAGKLDLDQDVNAYLNFRIPNAEGDQPVTLWRLLTHRAGFEEQIKGQVVAPGQPLTPLGVFVQENVPPRLFPRGDVPAYSNYGFTLAGYIIERMSGERFADYMAAHILRPLGLASTSFAQPLPIALAARRARAYSDARLKPEADELYQHVPAAGLSSSGADMAQLLKLLSSPTSLEQRHVLMASTYARLIEPQETAPPGINRMLLGWMERSIAPYVKLVVASKI